MHIIQWSHLPQVQSIDWEFLTLKFSPKNAMKHNNNLSLWKSGDLEVNKFISRNQLSSEKNTYRHWSSCQERQNKYLPISFFREKMFVDLRVHDKPYYGQKVLTLNDLSVFPSDIIYSTSNIPHSFMTFCSDYIKCSFGDKFH